MCIVESYFSCIVGTTASYYFGFRDLGGRAFFTKKIDKMPEVMCLK